MGKVSRHPWPADRRERIALIVENLTIHIPLGRRGRAERIEKDRLEEMEDETDDV